VTGGAPGRKDGLAAGAAGPRLIFRLGRAQDVPPGDGWLGPDERAVCCAFRVPKRRDDWRLGRWTAKQLVRAWLRRAGAPVPAPAEVQVIAARDGAPEVRLLCPGPALALSLSHSAGVAVAALAPAGRAIGCDVERVEPRSAAFVEDYFTEDEARRIRAAPPAQHDLVATLAWSAKESALKALRQGLRLDTRAVEVVWSGRRDGGGRLRIRSTADDAVFRGCWWHDEGYVVSLVADAPPAAQVPRVIRSQ
jgi:4'-phosphopantetheinyl transferase